MKNLKIAANYIPSTDKYVASYSSDTMDDIITSENGSALVDHVKQLLGVGIEYDSDNRTFVIPETYRF